MASLRETLQNLFTSQKATSESAPRIKPTGYEAYSMTYDLSTSTSKYTEYLNEMKGWVGSAVSVISDEVATMKLHLYRYNNGDIEEINEHPILDLLFKVNPYTTKFDHFWLTQAYLELTGEAPWYLERNGSEVTNVYFLRPDRIRPLVGKSRLIEGYEYDIGGERIRLDNEEVLFLKYPNPAKPFRGIGTLEMAARTVDIDNYSEEWNKNFYKNAARPDAILTVNTENMDKEQKMRLKESLKEAYTGVGNAHKIMVLFGDMKFEKSGFTMKDMDFAVQQDKSRDKILGIFRVPKSIVAQTEDVNYASAKTAQYVFARWTIKPKMERLIQQLNEFLLPMFDGTEDLYLDYENPVQEDELTSAQVNQIAIQSGYMTINEVREKMNLESVDGGDVIYLPFGMQPLEDPNAQDVPEAPIPEKPTTDEQKRVMLVVKPLKKKIIPNPDRIRELQARSKKYFEKKKLEGKFRKEVRDAIMKEFKTIKSKKKEHDEDDDGKTVRLLSDEQIKNFWVTKNELFRKYLPKIHSALVLVFKEERRITLTKYAKARKKFIDAEVTQKGTDDLFNDIKLNPDAEIKRILKVTFPLFKELYRIAGDETYALLELQDEFNIDREEIQQFLKDTGRAFATKVTETTNNTIREQLIEGLGAGESVEKVRDRIKDVFDQAEQYRADRIARTETLRYNTSATEQAFVDSGLVEGKMWVTNPNPCQYCAMFSGKTAGLGEIFIEKGTTVLDRVFDYEDLPAPPLHPNCECDLVPIFKPIG